MLFLDLLLSMTMVRLVDQFMFYIRFLSYVDGHIFEIVSASYFVENG